MKQDPADDSDHRRPATKLVQGGRRKDWTGLASGGAIVSPPVWRASTILYDDTAALKAGLKTNEDGKLFYGRRGTPTQWSLADALTELEPGAAGTMLFPSGAAAVAGALTSVLKAGDHLLMVDTVYDPTRRLCDAYLTPRGVTTTYYDPLIGAGIDSLVQANTRAIFMESPGSLTFEVQDVPAIVAMAKSRGLVTLIDNTWATPLYLPVIAMGVDLSIIACTKYIVGHSDAMIGSVTSAPATWGDLRLTAQVLGQHVGPDDAWLAMRGMRTLDVRLARHRDSALEIAHWLCSRPEVSSVLHPAIPESPGHEIFLRDFRGSSGLFSFALARGSADRFVDSLHHFGIGYSWGGFESLALPVDPSRCRSVSSWQGGPLVRLQIGLEDVRDLIEDLGQALRTI
ncbi:cystathionine beta-lyase [Sphingomonas sp.]|uniref:cystathionine beta-lyase n=1 Tax=Sphingomonas sp. TaxID=28214 RepID=UPI0025D7F5AF|nr:cystathionine beta-lyase [Sphingomonas sp.]